MEDPKEREIALHKILSELYKYTIKSKEAPTEEWLREKIYPIEMIREVASEHEDRKTALEHYFYEHYKRGIEARLDQIRNVFKIHLNPHPKAKLRTVRSLMELIQDDKSVKANINEFKVSCEKDEHERLQDDFQRSPDIVIYPKRGESIDESLATVVELIKKIKQKMEDLEVYALPIQTLIPRDNFPITRMVHVAQSSGQFKEVLHTIIDTESMERNNDGHWYPIEGRTMNDSLTTAFFDPRNNSGFLHEDSDRAFKLFNPIQTEEAKCFIEKTKHQREQALAEAKKIREKYADLPDKPINFWGRIKKYLSF